MALHLSQSLSTKKDPPCLQLATQVGLPVYLILGDHYSSHVVSLTDVKENSRCAGAFSLEFNLCSLHTQVALKIRGKLEGWAESCQLLGKASTETSIEGW